MKKHIRSTLALLYAALIACMPLASFAKALQSDVIVASSSDIVTDAEVFKRAVDNGKILFISAPEMSIEDVAEILMIPLNTNQTYSPFILMAYSIFKSGDKYNVCQIYATYVEDETSSDKETTNKSINSYGNAVSQATDFADVILLNKFDNPNRLDPLSVVGEAVDNVRKIESFAKSVKENVILNTSKVNLRSFELPENDTASWHEILYVFNHANHIVAHVTCNLFAYAKGRGIVDQTNHNIYDVICSAEVCPYSPNKAGEYEVMIHCNTVNSKCRKTTNLPSGISYTKGVSLTGSYSVGDGPGGSVTYETDWTYNPESQPGRCYDITPGMQVATKVGYMRGAFASVSYDIIESNPTLTETVVTLNNISLGGWF